MMSAAGKHVEFMQVRFVYAVGLGEFRKRALFRVRVARQFERVACREDCASNRW